MPTIPQEIAQATQSLLSSSEKVAQFAQGPEHLLISAEGGPLRPLSYWNAQFQAFVSQAGIDAGEVSDIKDATEHLLTQTQQVKQAADEAAVLAGQRAQAAEDTVGQALQLYGSLEAVQQAAQATVDAAVAAQGSAQAAYGSAQAAELAASDAANIVSSKADQAALDSLAQTVEGKADKSALEDLDAADVGAVPTGRTVSAGSGLTGGGDLSQNRTISVDDTVARLGTGDTQVRNNQQADARYRNASNLNAGTLPAARLPAGLGTPMQGATASQAGGAGLVPAPQAGDQNKVLMGNGAWGEMLGGVWVVEEILNTPGVGTWIVPMTASYRIRVYGGGGGGGGPATVSNSAYDGKSGATTSFAGIMTASGGAGGRSSYASTGFRGGAGGSGSGGSVNISGSPGGDDGASGAGGGAQYGVYGRGGPGQSGGGGGGGGGFAEIILSLTSGDEMGFAVGAGGDGGRDGGYSGVDGALTIERRA